MNGKSRISFGPGAASLILIVVILSMSVLGILSLMNARNDHRLITRSVEVVQAGMLLNNRAERALANLDEIAVRGSLPAGMEMNGRTISWEESNSYRTLACAVELLPLGESERLRWHTHRLTAITEDIWS